jgi:hypothetical protein
MNADMKNLTQANHLAAWQATGLTWAEFKDQKQREIEKHYMWAHGLRWRHGLAE